MINKIVQVRKSLAKAVEHLADAECDPAREIQFSRIKNLVCREYNLLKQFRNE